MKANSILEAIGKTPHVKINKLFGNHNVWIKLERNNPGSSIKDRIALAMIEDAEAKGLLNPDSVIIEPTSGNTGIGLALVAAVKGYKLILVMPESMSVERRKLMSIYGAEFELTPREKGMKGAIEKAAELTANTPNAWSPSQFDNNANVEVHKRTTAQEILADFPDGIDYMITGVGTGGHITGVAAVLKEKFPNLKVFAVEPEASPVLSGGEPGPHPLQGIGAGFVPSIYEGKLIDGVITVSRDEAFDYARQLAAKEGILAGISTGASLAAVSKKIADIPEGATVLTFNYDTGERYLSVEGLF
ncbi:cysteine synthase A [Flavobacterium coralii]|uniref:cysteine synthase A n=1 Tax=Flavobacterium coralii TaxID=2838017 RepID=UPI000C4F8E88|nr:cysteine synthase A [Flavobacterium sp.]|tara:strand:- start:21529 stop:22437 length:909 start_codon:yes stop_codon:yes gene_type:complete